MIWCKQHKSQDEVVNAMYLRHLHNNQQWELKNQKRLAKRKLEKAQKEHAAAKAKHGKDKPLARKTKGSTDKLTLSDAMKSMLCTNVCISENEADAFL